MPGPGNYEPQYNYGKDSIRGVKIRQSLNPLSHSKSTCEVGPGSYNPTSDFGKNGPKYTFKERVAAAKRNELPGPGQYDPTDSLSKERVKTALIKGGERSQLLVQDKPGPGQYYRDADFGKNGVKTSIRGKKEYTIINDIPGPGAYDAREILTRSITPSYKQSSSKRGYLDSSPSAIPGPGAYQPHLATNAP